MDRVCSIGHLERLGYYGHECKSIKNTYLILKPNMHFNSLNEIISTAFISNDGEKEKPLHIKNFNLNALKETKFKKLSF